MFSFEGLQFGNPKTAISGRFCGLFNISDDAYGLDCCSGAECGIQRFCSNSRQDCYDRSGEAN